MPATEFSIAGIIQFDNSFSGNHLGTAYLGRDRKKCEPRLRPRLHTKIDTICQAAVAFCLGIESSRAVKRERRSAWLLIIKPFSQV